MGRTEPHRELKQIFYCQKCGKEIKSNFPVFRIPHKLNYISVCGKCYWEWREASTYRGRKELPNKRQQRVAFYMRAGYHPPSVCLRMAGYAEAQCRQVSLWASRPGAKIAMAEAGVTIFRRGRRTHVAEPISKTTVPPEERDEVVKKFGGLFK